MNVNLITALIAFSGVLLSVVASFFVSLRKSKIESQKIRDEYLHRYAGKIFESRLEAYPKLVEHLVIFFQKVNLSRIKKEQLYEIKIADIKNLFQIILDWDAHNSVLYSPELQGMVHKTYHNLYRLLNRPEEELQPLIKNDDSLKELRNELFALYLALKNDLGIYSFKSPSVITDFKQPDTVLEFSKLSNK